jgi:hypothetical protein
MATKTSEQTAVKRQSQGRKKHGLNALRDENLNLYPKKAYRTLQTTRRF